MNAAALIIAVSMLLSRILGMVREMLLAGIAGISPEKNALDLAFLIPDMLNHVVSTGFLSMIFIPIFTGYLVEKKEDQGWAFFSNILNVLGLLLLILLIPAWIFMKPLILLLTAVDPSPHVLARAVEFGRIILPAQIAFFAGSFLIAVQHTRRQFLLPSLTGVIYNVAIVMGGWLGRKHGLLGFAWGVPIGAFLGFFFLQVWGVYQRGGIQWHLKFDLKDSDVSRYLRLMLPLVLGVGAMFSMEFVIRSFGSYFGDTGISSLNYAYRLMYTLVAVFGFSVGVASYPDLARLAKQRDFLAMNTQIATSLGKMLTILIPTILAVWFLAFPAVRILFERGAFHRDASLLVTHLLRGYLPAALGLCFQAVLVRAYYAHERMWFPTLVNTGTFLLSLPLYFLLAPYWGVEAVPWIGAITALVQISILILVWKRFFGLKGIGQIPRYMFTGLLVLGILGCVLFFADTRLSHYWPHLSLIPLILISGSCGLFILYLGLKFQALIGNSLAQEILQSLRYRILRFTPRF